jgi:pimeloyl-ACP methyl ester carboxylesterase
VAWHRFVPAAGPLTADGSTRRRRGRRLTPPASAVASILSAFLACACTNQPSASGVRSAASTVSPSAASAPASALPSPTSDPTDLSPYAGVYRTSGGATYLVSRSALLVNTSDSSVRSIAVAQPGTLSVGPSFGVLAPAAGQVVFAGMGSGGSTSPSGFKLHWAAGGSVSAARVPTSREDVRIPSDGAQLAATLTRPAGPGRLPAIAIVHGSGPETRSMLDIWTQLYASLGLAVLAYNKRGVGESTGTFPGDNARPETLELLAGDAAAVVTYLRSRSDIDPARVALYGGSQGGWVVPIADAKVRPAFSIIASGPPMTTQQQAFYASLSGGGTFVPSLSDAEIDKELADQRGGYDPGPVLAADTTPTLWIFGASDRHVPARLGVANLTRLHRPNFTWRVLPRSSHNLVDTGTGLDADDDAATQFGAGLFSSISAWVRQQAFGP